MSDDGIRELWRCDRCGAMEWTGAGSGLPPRWRLSGGGVLRCEGEDCAHVPRAAVAPTGDLPPCMPEPPR
jgi:hypothetical protein